MGLASSPPVRADGPKVALKAQANRYQRMFEDASVKLKKLSAHCIMIKTGVPDPTISVPDFVDPPHGKAN